MFRKVFGAVLLATWVVLIEMHGYQPICSNIIPSSVDVLVTGLRNPSGHWVSQVVVGEDDQDRDGKLDVDVQYVHKECNNESRTEVVLTFTVPPANTDSAQQHGRQATRPVSVYGRQDRRVKYPPAGYIALQNIGYYKIYRTSVTWSTARHQCNKDGGHLASINTCEELEFIKKINPIQAWAWIDIHERGVDDVYYNATGEIWEKPSCVIWYPPYPTCKTGADCGMILLSDGRICDWQCERHTAEYVCEIPWSSI